MKSTLCVVTLFAFSMLGVRFISPQVAAAAEATTGLIVGTVTSTSGEAVARARVSAASASGRYSALTDAHGRFAILGVVPDEYVVSVEAAGYENAFRRARPVGTGTAPSFQSRSAPIDRKRTGARKPSRRPRVRHLLRGRPAARANFPTASAAGLANYTQGTVQGAIANVPGVDLDPFANAILRGGRVSDAVFEYDSVPIPQGLIAEPGGNVDGAQLPTTGVASTNVILAGYSNEGDNALGGIVNQIPAVGSYPGQRDLRDRRTASGTQSQFSNLQMLGATPDLQWRYALASTARKRVLHVRRRPDVLSLRSRHVRPGAADARAILARDERALPGDAGGRRLLSRARSDKRHTTSTVRRTRVRRSARSTARRRRIRAKSTRTNPSISPRAFAAITMS